VAGGTQAGGLNMLRLDNISLQIGGFSLRSINLHIRRGEYRVILGPTGAGKTVLLETIAGLNRPHQGTIFLTDENITTTAPEKRHFGMVYQDYALFPHLSVFHNIAFGLRLQPLTKKAVEQKVTETAEFFRISHLLKRLPKNLSGGECQRVALTRALALEPAMLLLDEPLSALDRLTRNRLQEELQRVHRQLGMTVVHITHDLNEAFFLADRMAVMHDGRIVQEGRPEEIARRPKTKFVAELMGLKNFIPARVTTEGMIKAQGLGTLNRDLLRTTPKQAGDFLLTFPAQAVEITPVQAGEFYCWRGMTRIIEMNQGRDRVDIKLVLPDDTIIHTAFSQREMSRFPFTPAPGMKVETGIVAQGLHLLTAE